MALAEIASIKTRRRGRQLLDIVVKRAINFANSASMREDRRACLLASELKSSHRHIGNYASMLIENNDRALWP